MAYEKKEHTSFEYAKVFVGMFVMALLGLSAIFIWTNKEPAPTETVLSTGESGQIAQLSDNQFVAGATTDDVSGVQASPAQETTTLPTEATSLSSEPFTTNLPDGWTLSNTATQESICTPELMETITVYTNGSRTITVYENGTAAGCDGNIVADKQFNFAFTETGDSIVVDTSNSSEFCTKEENSTCPKGDGVVTVFVGSPVGSPIASHSRNSLTNNTYFFKIEDSNLEQDLLAQAADLAQLAEAIVIN